MDRGIMVILHCYLVYLLILIQWPPNFKYTPILFSGLFKHYLNLEQITQLRLKKITRFGDETRVQVAFQFEAWVLGRRLWVMCVECRFWVQSETDESFFSTRRPFSFSFTNPFLSLPEHLRRRFCHLSFPNLAALRLHLLPTCFVLSES